MNEDGETVEDAGLQCRSDDACDCVSIQEPGLSDWALHIQLLVANGIYLGMVDEEFAGVNEDDVMAAHSIEQWAFERVRELQWADWEDGLSSLGELPVLEIRQMSLQAAMDDRAQILEDNLQ